MNTVNKIECSICSKIYSSKASLLNHNRIYHNIKIYKLINTKQCKYCNKPFASSQSRLRHENKCTITELDENKNQETDETNYELILLKEKLEKSEEIIRLQNKLLKSKKIDTKTFKAVNKILMDRSYNNALVNANNNVNSNNRITNHNNNYQIFAVGNEDLINVLTLEQKKQIMNSRLGSIEKIVEIAHCSHLNQFKNIIITNLKDNYAYRYDERKGYFVTVTKDVLLDNLVMNRVMDIEDIYDELKNANKIDIKTKKLIQDFLDKMAEENIPFFDSETKYDNFKTYKTNNIKIMLYNNQDKITKDIALLISTSNENNMREQTNQNILQITPPIEQEDQEEVSEDQELEEDLEQES